MKRFAAPCLVLAQLVFFSGCAPTIPPVSPEATARALQASSSPRQLQSSPLPEPAGRNSVPSELALSFEANLGQAGESVAFLSRGRGYRLAVTPTPAAM